MGTDVYLEWNGKTKEDQEKQYTGYSINAGNVGYLRASIGMVDENKVLRALFSEKIWESRDEKGEIYDFKANLTALMPILRAYLDGDDIDVQERTKSQQEQGKAILTLLKKAGWESIGGSKSDKNDIEGRKMWANSVVEFFVLGTKLQMKGKEPRVYISW